MLACNQIHTIHAYMGRSVDYSKRGGGGGPIMEPERTDGEGFKCLVQLHLTAGGFSWGVLWIHEGG